MTSEGNIQVVGWTWSSNFPATTGTPFHGQNDIFVTEIDPEAPAEEQLVISELIGGGSYDPPGDCIGRPDGSIIIGGNTGGGFPATPDALRPFDATDQAFLIEWRRDLEVAPAARLRYASALTSGAACWDFSLCDRVWDLALGPGGTVMACGLIGGYLAGATAGSAQGDRAGATDMFVVSLDLRSPEARCTASPVQGTAPLEVCFDASASSTPGGTAIAGYSWDFGDGEQLETEGAKVCHVYAGAGQFVCNARVASDLGLISTAQPPLAVSVACPGGDVSPWQSADVGAVQLPGGSRRDDTSGEGCLSICATGTGLIGTADSFHFVYQAVNENGGTQCLTAGIADLDAENSGAVAGVMFRESTAADARFAAVQLRNLASRRVDLHYRDDLGRARSVRGPAVEKWPVGVRLEHRRTTGPTEETLDEFVGYARVGGEGAEWVEVGRTQIQAVPEGESLLAGIVATAGIPATATTFQALQATVCDLSLSSEPCPAPPGPVFRRADSNSDAGVDISDAVFTLNWLFLGGTKPDCVAALNVNGDGGVDIADAVHLLSHLFLGGPAPAAPFPGCGTSALAADTELGCETPPAGCQ